MHRALRLLRQWVCQAAPYSVTADAHAWADAATIVGSADPSRSWAGRQLQQLPSPEQWPQALVAGQLLACVHTNAPKAVPKCCKQAPATSGQSNDEPPRPPTGSSTKQRRTNPQSNALAAEPSKLSPLLCTNADGAPMARSAAERACARTLNLPPAHPRVPRNRGPQSAGPML
jgi:hypothetical protein